MSGLRSAIDSLLTSGSCEVSEPCVKLTECNPDIGIIMSGQGGICTNCNVMFKTKTSLTNHLTRCVPSGNSGTSETNVNNESGEFTDSKESSDCCNSDSSSPSGVPRLIIMKN